jgi:3-oxoacyl-[acyl-carrier protein] reductase
MPEKAKKLGLSIEDARKTFENEYALRRISTGQDIANAVLFLASDMSRQITGVDLPVDGGWADL